MKIGLVCPYHIFLGGGVQECVFAVQKELESRGHTAKIITPQPRDINGAKHDNPSIDFVGTSANIKSPFHTTAQVSVNLDNRAIEELLTREKFDVLHFHEPWVPIMSRQLLASSDTINVATFHAKLPETVMAKTIERVITPYTKSVLKYIDAFSAVSDAAAQYVRTITNEPIAIVPNGIDLKAYSPVKPRKVSKKPVITYIGRLEKRKGIKYLLEAFALYADRNPDAQLRIAGNGPDREKLEQMVEENAIPNVTFLGYISDKDKKKLLDATDLFCSPALYGESFGIVLLEAMAKGIVTIAADNPGYAAVMKDRGTLSLVNPTDTDQFVRRMQLLLEDEPTRQLWREWAQAYVQQFDYARIVDQYLNLYKQAQKKKSHDRNA